MISASASKFHSKQGGLDSTGEDKNKHCLVTPGVCLCWKCCSGAGCIMYIQLESSSFFQRRLTHTTCFPPSPLPTPCNLEHKAVNLELVCTFPLFPVVCLPVSFPTCVSPFPLSIYLSPSPLWSPFKLLFSQPLSVTLSPRPQSQRFFLNILYFSSMSLPFSLDTRNT